MTDDNALARDARKLVTSGGAIAKELIYQKGLYASIDISTDVGAEAYRQILNAQIGITDCYCTTCKKETPFIIQPIPYLVNRGGGLRHNDALAIPPSVFALRAVCQRDLNTYLYCFFEKNKILFKIGQWPSMADISFGELKGIDKDLESADRIELGKALGLFSHDATLGAFVYLRRVFERMINRAHERQSASGNAINEFSAKRMDEKIALLGSELPEKIVKNSAVFSVLSLGIHELTDEQCQSMFPLMKAIIFQMLEHEEHKRRKAKADRETDSALQVLLSSVKTDTPVGK